jgi:hypothetical protein
MEMTAAAADARKHQGEETLQRYMSGETVPWGPHVGPPPFAPPFAPPFEQWYREALRDGHISADLSYEDAYADYYNLSGTPQEWAARGYIAAQPAPAPEHTKTGPNAGLHAALRGAASRLLDAEELRQLDVVLRVGALDGGADQGDLAVAAPRQLAGGDQAIEPADVVGRRRDFRAREKVEQERLVGRPVADDDLALPQRAPQPRDQPID